MVLLVDDLLLETERDDEPSGKDEDDDVDGMVLVLAKVRFEEAKG